MFYKSNGRSSLSFIYLIPVAYGNEFSLMVFFSYVVYCNGFLKVLRYFLVEHTTKSFGILLSVNILGSKVIFCLMYDEYFSFELLEILNRLRIEILV